MKAIIIIIRVVKRFTVKLTSILEPRAFPQLFFKLCCTRYPAFWDRNTTSKQRPLCGPGGGGFLRSPIMKLGPCDDEAFFFPCFFRLSFFFSFEYRNPNWITKDPKDCPGPMTYEWGWTRFCGFWFLWLWNPISILATQGTVVDRYPLTCDGGPAAGKNSLWYLWAGLHPRAIQL